MLIMNDLKQPQDTIIYCAGCILLILKKIGRGMGIEFLFNSIKVEYNKNINYTDFILALDFLYLLKKIDFDNEEKICILES